MDTNQPTTGYTDPQQAQPAPQQAPAAAQPAPAAYAPAAAPAAVPAPQAAPAAVPAAAPGSYAAAPAESKGSIGKMLIGLAAFAAAIVLEGVAVSVAFALTDDTLPLETIYQIVSAGIALLIFAALGGSAYLHFDGKKIMAAIKDCWWLLLIDFVILGLTLFSAFTDGDTLTDNWLLLFILSAILCLGIGLSEEGLFRGLLLHGLLAKMGVSKKGVVWAIIISSVVFGLFHVLPADPSEFTPLGILQMILKTAQTGLCGVIWAAVVIHYDDIWGAAIVHALSDFLLIFPDIIFGYMDSALSTDYVSTDEEAMATIMVYVVFIALYIPLIVRSIKVIRQMETPDMGAFVPAAAAVSAGAVAAAEAPTPAQPSRLIVPAEQTPVTIAPTDSPFQAQPVNSSAMNPPTVAQEAPYIAPEPPKGPVPPSGWGA